MPPPCLSKSYINPSKYAPLLSIQKVLGGVVFLSTIFQTDRTMTEFCYFQVCDLGQYFLFSEIYAFLIYKVDIVISGSTLLYFMRIKWEKARKMFDEVFHSKNQCIVFLFMVLFLYT